MDYVKSRVVLVESHLFRTRNVFFFQFFCSQTKAKSILNSVDLYVRNKSDRVLIIYETVEEQA